jgi:hypothetical protein
MKQPNIPPREQTAPTSQHTSPHCLSWHEWDTIPASHKIQDTKGEKYLYKKTSQGVIFTPVILV